MDNELDTNDELDMFKDPLFWSLQLNAFLIGLILLWLVS